MMAPAPSKAAAPMGLGGFGQKAAPTPAPSAARYSADFEATPLKKKAGKQVLSCLNLKVVRVGKQFAITTAVFESVSPFVASGGVPTSVVKILIN